MDRCNFSSRTQAITSLTTSSFNYLHNEPLPFKLSHFLSYALILGFSATAQSYEPRSGGDTTVIKSGPNAYSLPAANLPMSKRLDFSVGNSFFRNPWVSAPASTDARDGLGPLFNTNGCQNCHIKDGRGHPPEEGEVQAVSMLVRLSVLALTQEQKKQILTSGVIPEPTYGGQLQDFALESVKPEGKIKITYEPKVLQFKDGETITLRKPHLEITDLGYGPMSKDVLMSARVAPPMIGLGLLEAISAETLTALSDPDDRDQDGISGKLNQVWDVEKQALSMGRFGWKAGQPTVKQQNAAAFNGDLGLSTSLFPDDNCSLAQSVCKDMPHGRGSSDASSDMQQEVSDKILNFVTFYAQHLAVPSRRNPNDSQVKQGQALFNDIGCASCHIPTLKTANTPDLPSLSNQTISPYTDLLLHDMGDGLSDGRGEFLATGNEWRTPPLWGAGYTQEVNGHTYFLHDGRARNLMEAILWHGGEAEEQQKAVLALDKDNREALIAFLESL